MSRVNHVPSRLLLQSHMVTRVGEHCVGFHNGFVGRGAGIAADARIAAGHRFHAVRAQLLEMAGDPAAARTAYLEAARHTTSLPHQRYLHARAARLAGAG